MDDNKYPSNTQLMRIDGDEDIIQHIYPNIETLEELIGFKLYFPPIDPIAQTNLNSVQNEHELNQERLSFIQLILPYFRELCRDNIYAADENNAITLDYMSLKNNVFKPQDRFDMRLIENPQFVIDCIGVVLYQILYCPLIKNEDDETLRYSQSTQIFSQKKKINVRILNFEPVLPLRKLKSNLIGKFVSIKGTVIRVGYVRPLVKSMKYKCATCGIQQLKYFNEGKVVVPTACQELTCKSKTFEPLRHTAVTVDWQKIKIQEESDQKDQKSGIPKNIECELTEDLVESVVPGDIVTLSGTIKVLKQDEGFNSTNKTVYYLYIDTNSIDSNKNSDDTNKDNVNFTLKDMYGIKAIAEQPNIFHLIVNSICPAIYGHEMVKAGLTLALFGGNARSEKNKLPIRGDPHVLIVGDPGLGKSQMLKAFQNISPRGVYVSGGYTTKTGMTVSLTREGGSGDFALEAGALVLGDQGCCCIDEFDKMEKEHTALLEAMEQQSVSIAKAGIVCNLPARTSVIAAANPAGGHYSKAKTVAENIKMKAPLLSRFDLIFILLDKPNQNMDKIISHHIMDLHSGRNDNKRKATPSSQMFLQPSQVNNGDKPAPLLYKLILQPNEEFEPISPIILRKYISYAKKYVTPVLSDEAVKIIQDFYLELRNRSSKQDSAPVTTRQLESLIRLAEARAKLELREEVTEQDAMDVVEIFKESLIETFEDEYGNVDFRRSSSMGKASLAKKYASILSRESSKKGTSEFSKNEIYSIMKENKLPIDKFEDIFVILNDQGMILKKGGKYKVQATY